jgi:hypothetical protein
MSDYLYPLKGIRMGALGPILNKPQQAAIGSNRQQQAPALGASYRERSGVERGHVMPFGVVT